MSQAGEKSKWHVSREVPLSLVYVIVGWLLSAVAFAAIFWASTNKDVADHEKRISTLENQKLSERIISLEQQMADAKRLMEKMDSKLDQLLLRGQERKSN